MQTEQGAPFVEEAYPERAGERNEQEFRQPVLDEMIRVLEGKEEQEKESQGTQSSGDQIYRDGSSANEFVSEKDPVVERLEGSRSGGENSAEKKIESNTRMNHCDVNERFFDDFPVGPGQPAGSSAFLNNFDVEYWADVHQSGATMPQSQLHSSAIDNYQIGKPAERPLERYSEESVVGPGSGKERSHPDQFFEVKVGSNQEFDFGHHDPSSLSTFQPLINAPLQHAYMQQTHNPQSYNQGCSVQQHYPERFYLQQPHAQHLHTKRSHATNIPPLVQSDRPSKRQTKYSLCPSRNPPQTSPCPVPNVAATGSLQTVPATRQEQLWRSTPHGPYLRGTRNPKKVVRNAFLNEWLRLNRPDIPLPDSSGQGFKEQSRVFDSLSPPEREAANAFAVRKAEAEQAERRSNGTAQYKVSLAPSAICNHGAKRQGSASSTAHLQNIPSARMQDLADAQILGQRTAPVPQRHSQHGGYGSVLQDAINHYPDHAQGMYYATIQGEYPLDPSLSQTGPNQTFGSFQEHASGGYSMNQSHIQNPACNNGNSMSQNQNSSFMPYGFPVSHGVAQIPTNASTFGMPNPGLMHGMYPPTASLPGYPTYMIQHEHQMSAYRYTAEGQWHGNGLMCSAHPPIDPFSFHFHQQFNGMSPTENFGTGIGLRLNHQGWGNSPRGGSPSMEYPQHRHAENSLRTNQIYGRKRRQAEEDNNAVGDAENEQADGPASKRVRRT
jgi:hypothetical protein